MGWFQYCGAVVVVLLLAAPSVGAAPQPVGLAAGESMFSVGSSLVEGQATLFEGDEVRTSYLATRVHLKDGSKYVLGIDSAGAVYRDRLLLRSGGVEIANAGHPSRVVVSSVQVAAEKPGSSATVYLTGKETAAVLVRAGEVKVSRVGGAPVATLSAGQTAALKMGPKGAVQVDSQAALSEVTRMQSEQLAGLGEAARDISCLAPKVQLMSRSFASLTSQLAASQAARGLIQSKIDSGIATSSDRQNMAVLNDKLRTLSQASAVFSEDLDNVVYQFHHPGPPVSSVSPHTVHGHSAPEHHGQHGHTIPFGGGGHHEVPPHLP